MGYADDDDDFGIELGGWQPDMDTGAYPIIRGAGGEGSGYAGGEGSGGAGGEGSGGAGGEGSEEDYPDPFGRTGVPGQEFGVPSLRARIARLHPDRWILAIGSMAAAVTFVAAVAAAGGSTTQGRAVVPGAVVAPAAAPGCVFPASGR